MHPQEVVIVGGGAAGFFAAIQCAAGYPDTRITLLDKGAEFLSKVRISGGGRCNLTHACFDPRELSSRYPRGGKALIGAFHRFQPADTVSWFESRGVKLKVEPDGRVFPASDSSQTIIDCLLDASAAAGVVRRARCGVEKAERCRDGGFLLTLSGGQTVRCRRLLLATGGCRTPSAGRLAVALGHTLEPPVPSLFTFRISSTWLQTLAGISLQSVAVSVPGTRLQERGPALITHQGLSGPVILRLSAWGARPLHECRYHFPLQLNWLPDLTPEDLAAEFQIRRSGQSARTVVNSPIAPLPARLWEGLVRAAGVEAGTRWAELSRAQQHQLMGMLACTRLQVAGKSLNQDEFVTCGGVRLSEVNFKTMESRVCPGLFFAGELLDIDGLTGGFNFQAAWTTGWIAGRSLGHEASESPQ
jgi:predicted Rossmann fold flavoprotein